MKKRMLIDAAHIDCSGLTVLHYGIYARIILAMYQGEIVGQVSGTEDDLIKITGCSKEELRDAINAFEGGFYLKVYETNGFFRLVSGAVTKAHQIGLYRSVAGRKGADSRLGRGREYLPLEPEPVLPKQKKVKVAKEKHVDHDHPAATAKWFLVYNELKETKPTYGKTDARALKELLEKIRGKMREHGMDVNQQNTIQSLEAFLRKAEKMKFIKANYRLPIINQQFDVIYLHGKKGAKPSEADSGDIADAVSGLYPKR